MRISDWSSDVCSSDLGVRGHAIYLQEIPVELDAERPLPWLPFGQEVGPESFRSDSRIVHEDVDVTEPIDGSLHEPLAIIVPGNIPLKREHPVGRSEEHTSELTSLMRISYAVFCLKKKQTKK